MLNHKTKKCPHCKGCGNVMIQHPLGRNGWIEHPTQCSHCNGTGEEEDAGRSEGMRGLIGKVKEDIKSWRKVSESKETPKRQGETFEHGWRLAINRVCNSIEKIVDEHVEP